MTDRTPAAQTSEPQTANWDEFACDGEKCGCHDPFICSTCGCTHNEAEADDAECGCGAIGVAKHTNAQHYGNALPADKPEPSVQAQPAGLDAERLNLAAYRTPKLPAESMKEWLYRVAAAYAEGEPE